MKIRAKFEKKGFSQFLGHLDVMRYFQKLMRRADIDIRYSEGFSPHQIMSFANPLGLGQTSEGEYMDIEVNTLDFASGTALTEHLNRFAADGIKVLECRILPDKAPNAMASVAAARYVLSVRDNVSEDLKETFVYPFDYPEAVSEFFGRDEIVVTKKTKKSETELDIRPLIFDWKLEGQQIELFVSAGSAANLKPELVMQSLHEAMNLPYNPMQYQLHRLDMYMQNPETGERLSLLEVGEPFGNTDC